MKLRAILLAFPIYYVICCLLAVVFSAASGEFSFIEVPQYVGVMFLVGWVAMLGAISDSSVFGSPAPMQLAMALGAILTLALLKFMAGHKRSPYLR